MALRVHQFLRSLERDLLERPRDHELRVAVHRNGGDEVTLELEIPHLRARRRCSLSSAEYRLLLDNPEVRAILEEPAR